MWRTILLILLWACAGAAQAKPQRIVSLNLCTDQLLLQLVEPERIAALTYLADDPRQSVEARRARGIRKTRGTAEDVVALDADLIVAGTFSTRETVTLLRRLGHDVLDFTPAASVADIRRDILAMGDAVGEPARAARLVARFDKRLAALSKRGGNRPLFTDYGPNGYVSGEGTLLAELAARAGFEPLGTRLGIAGMRQVPLEQLVLTRPTLIDLGERPRGPAMADRLYTHPALQALTRGGRSIRIPSRLTSCGTVRSLDALAMLVQARDRLP